MQVLVNVHTMQQLSCGSTTWYLLMSLPEAYSLLAALTVACFYACLGSFIVFVYVLC